MAGEPFDLVLEHLKRIQEEFVRGREDQRAPNAQLSAVRQIQSAHSTLLHQLVEDNTGIRARLDRIERRLDLTEVAK